MSQPSQASRSRAHELRDGEAYVTLEERGFPLVVHRWVGRATTRLVERYYAHLDELVEAGRAFVLVTDTRQANAPDASVRTLIARLNKARTGEHERLNLGNFVIVDNALIRGTLTALTWLDPNIGSVKYVASEEDGLARADEVLRDAGLRSPA